MITILKLIIKPYSAFREMPSHNSKGNFNLLLLYTYTELLLDTAEVPVL